MSSQLNDILDQLSKLPSSERSAAAKRACADDLPLLAAVLQALPREPDSRELLRSAAPTPADAPTTASTALTNTPKPIAPADPGAPSSSPAQATTAVPARVGTIDLIEEIGRGGMGVVWRGRDTLLGREVAVKLLGLGKPSREALCEGVRGIIDIEHPGLVRVYSAGQHDELVYVVMELIEGESLASVLHRVGKLDAATARQIMIQVCEAVGALHSRGVVHRDIKPGNIMLSRDGRVLVTDFGLASERPYGTIGGDAAQSAFTAGTPVYMAPEMFEGLVTARTDVYALGVTLYEMLTGRTPFDGPVAALRDAHAAREVPLFELRESQPQLAEIIERAMQKDPLFRYKTADRMAIAVQHVEGMPTSDIQLLLREGNSITSERPTARNTPSTASTDLLSVVRATRAEIRLHEPAIGPDANSDLTRTKDGHGTSHPSPHLPPVWPEPCANCGYDLSGHGNNRICPECGMWSAAGTTFHGFDGWTDDQLNNFGRRIEILSVIGLLLPAIAAVGIEALDLYEARPPNATTIVSTSIVTCILFATRFLVAWGTRHAMHHRTFQQTRWSRITTYGLLSGSFMVATIVATWFGERVVSVIAFLAIFMIVYARLVAFTDGSPSDAWRSLANSVVAGRSIGADRTEFVRRLRNSSRLSAHRWHIRTWLWSATSYVIFVFASSLDLRQTTTVAWSLSWRFALALLCVWAILFLPLTRRLSRIYGDLEVYTAKARSRSETSSPGN